MLPEIKKLKECEKCALYDLPIINYPLPKKPCKLVIVGESAGLTEVKKGYPFAGKSGDFLEGLLSSVGLEREEVYITNALKCFPGAGKEKRKLKIPDIVRCRKLFLVQELEHYKDIPALALGRPAAISVSLFFFPKKKTLKELAGKVVEGNGYRAGFARHPAWYMRQPGDAYSQFIKFTKPVLEKLLYGGSDVDIHRRDLPFKYEVKTASEALQFIRNNWASDKVVVFDIETNGKAFASGKCKITCIGLLHEDNPEYVLVVIPEPESVFPTLIGELKRFKLVAHNGKFDINTIRHLTSIRLTLCEDTLLAAYAVDQTRKEYSLESLTYQYNPDCALWKGDTKSGKKASVLVGPELYEYNAIDVYATFRLWKKLAPEVERNRFLYHKLLMGASDYFADAEFNGAVVDLDRLKFIADVCRMKVEDIKKEFTEMEEVKQFEQETGKSYNPNSNQHNLYILQKVKKFTYYNPRRKEEILVDATNKKVLSNFEHDRFVRKLLEWRTVSRMESTYAQRLKRKLVLCPDGVYRGYPSFFLHRTVSGRTASSALVRDSASPIKRDDDDLSFNFQNFPREGPFRGVIIPPPGYIIISFDYSTLEMRVVAAIARDPVLRDIFLSGKDFHRSMAAKIYGVDYGAVTKKQRQDAKKAVFGLLYGASPEMLVENFKIPLEEAQSILSSYMNSIPVTKAWIEYTKKEIERTGRVVTPFGRVRRFDDPKSNAAKREGVNTIIQATASDIMLLSLTIIKKELVARNWWEKEVQFFVAVHDSASFYVKEDPVIIDECLDLFSRAAIMEVRKIPEVEEVLWEIPLLIDWKIGARWS